MSSPDPDPKPHESGRMSGGYEPPPFGCILAFLSVVLLGLAVIGLCGAGSVQTAVIFVVLAAGCLVLAVVIGLASLFGR